MQAQKRKRFIRLAVVLAVLLGALLPAALAFSQAGPAAPATATLTLDKTTTPAGGQDFWLSAVSFQGSWGRRGSGNGQFRQPRDVDVDAAGNFYITDHRNSRIQKFSPSGAFLGLISRQGKANGRLLRPNAIAISGNNLIVTDTDNNRIQVFSLNGNYVRKWGSLGTGNGQFNKPNGVAVDDAGNVYVADTWNHRVQVFNLDGTYLSQWGAEGTADGQFKFPAHLDVEGSEVYVTDSNNHRVQVFNTNGTFARKFGSLGSGPGQFFVPVGIDVAGGFVYIGDTFNNRVVKLTTTGTPVAVWSEVAGGGTISRPNGLMESDGILYVSDLDANRVQIYSHVSGTLDDGQEQALTLPAGTYNITEAAKSGWTFGSATCSGGSPSPIANGVRVTLANGASVGCSFVNNQ